MDILNDDGVDYGNGNKVYFKHTIEDFDDAPQEISGIANLQKLVLCEKEDVCGVYFLCYNTSVVYVGQTVNFKNRLKQHSKSEKWFDAAYFIRVPQDRLLEVERALINYLQPPLNKSRDKGLRFSEKETIIELLGADLTMFWGNNNRKWL